MVKEATATPTVDPPRLVFDFSEYIEMHDPAEEVEEKDVLVASRRRRTVDPPAADESQPLIVEEASRSVIVEGVLGDLEPAETIESQPGAEGEIGDTKSFAFDTREDEELPTEAQVEQPVEVM